MHFGAADIEETLVLLGTCQVRFRHVCADLMCRGHAVLMLSRVHQYSAASRDCTSCRVCDSRVYVMHASQAAHHESGCVLQGLTSGLGYSRFSRQDHSCIQRLQTENLACF